MIKLWLRKLFSKLLSSSEEYTSFKQLAHPQSIYSENSEVSKKSTIQGPARMIDTKIDAYCYISENAKLSKTEIGKFCSIGPNLLSGYGIHPTSGISTSPMFYSTLQQNGTTLSESNKIEERKEIVIGNDVFIGMNVTILDGVTIGDGAVIGAGAVVSKNIPAYAIAVGNPITITRYRFTDEQIAALLKIQWWNFSDEKLKDVERCFFDVDSFISKHSNA